MNDLDEGPDVVDGCLRQDAVAEVEDMAGASAGLCQDPSGLAGDLPWRGEQDDRIEVPLDGDPVTEPIPGPVQVDPPVQADDRAARVSLKLQQGARVRPEMDHRDRRIEPGEEPRTCAAGRTAGSPSG